jgi:D-alanyl-D-alanine carboxypeptidase
MRWILIVAVLASCRGTSKNSEPTAGSGSVGGATAAAPPIAPTLPWPAGVDNLVDEVEAVRAAKKLPAVAAAVWRDGKLVAIGAIGQRKAGDLVHRVTIEDRWHLGSNTKAMTATLIGLYIDRKTLAWDDTLAKLFAGERIHPDYAKVTLDQLLRHTGGAPAQPPEVLWKRLWTDGTAPEARIKLVRDVLAAKPAQAPGTFVYSNTGYMIAGAALERATKKRWQDLMREDLFAPLGMTSCGFGAPGSATAIDQPWGHDASGAAVPPGPEADNPPGLGPAGTVHCTLADYGKFLAVHAGATKLVEPATLAHLQDAPSGGYAGGWMVIVGKRGKILAHSGSNTMWFATAVVSPASKVAWVIASNKSDATLEGAVGPLIVTYGPPPT